MGASLILYPHLLLTPAFFLLSILVYFPQLVVRVVHRVVVVAERVRAQLLRAESAGSC